MGLESYNCLTLGFCRPECVGIQALLYTLTNNLKIAPRLTRNMITNTLTLPLAYHGKGFRYSFPVMHNAHLVLASVSVGVGLNIQELVPVPYTRPLFKVYMGTGPPYSLTQ